MDTPLNRTAVGHRHPYYFSVPDFQADVPALVQIHELCSRLNQLGYEAYVFGAKALNGLLWTPVLTTEVRVAHYKARRKPTWIHLQADSTLRRQSHWTLSYAPETHLPSSMGLAKGEMQWSSGAKEPALRLPIALPWVDDTVFHSQGVSERSAPLVYAAKYLQAKGVLQDEHQGLVNIADTEDKRFSAQERADLFRQASALYCYETATAATEARLCGCPVVYIQNDRFLQIRPHSSWETFGTSWGEAADELEQARTDLAEFALRYRENVKDSEQELLSFVTQTQAAIDKLEFEEAWSSESVALLGEHVVNAKELGAHADQSKYARIQTQYTNWKKRSSLREVDGEIYAEYLVSGTLPALAAVIFVKPGDHQGLADTLDSLARNFIQPFRIDIVANFDCPVEPSDLGSNCTWHLKASGLESWTGEMPGWALMVESGTRLFENALAEFALAARASSVDMVYADEEFVGARDTLTPHFKPALNVEWLRCTNYLGSAVALRTPHWVGMANPLDFEHLYGLALSLSFKQGANAIAHIDTVLYSSTGTVSAEREANEIGQLRSFLNAAGLNAQVQTQKMAGCWQIEYQSKNQRTVSMVIPTGRQLGYLRCLLGSLSTHASPELVEVILVVQPDHEVETRRATEDLLLPVPLRILTSESGTYKHSTALNVGARAAVGELVLFADDDTEIIQQFWLQSLTSYFDQADICCVAPRLVLQVEETARLQNGPFVLISGEWGTSYNGERHRLDEQGVFSRLQTSQDVGAVAGHFFIATKSAWTRLEGFDEVNQHSFTTIQDFCLRATTQCGLRHIWTPISNVLHHGGKTLESVNHDFSKALEIRASSVQEKRSYHRQWMRFIAGDKRYNRQLSTLRPYDVEGDIVVDWMPDRKDRPTAIAFPISSGSGQYRVIDPLNALQHAGKAQTCIVYPIARAAYRTPTPVEVMRANPDRLIIQHSISDGHIQLLREYRNSGVNVFTIQMVDDLFQDLPEKHPLHNVHQREGYMRMREAVALSDRLIVSTEPLAEVYGKYCADVRVMPNCLDDKIWGTLAKPRQARERLRVGWAGAGQHLGDLEMIRDVVAAFKDEVDWIFMGMCPDGLRSYIKEFHPFVSYADYPAKLASLDLDLAIAPLEDNAFNQCKSNLRLLEYGAMGWPVVCSDVYPFRTNNPPVLRAPNEKDAWIDAIRKLLNEEDLRLKMGRDLHQWVSSNYFLSKNVEQWKSAIFD
jgi:glycosyltransferase involved in cell wall biosynthesis